VVLERHHTGHVNRGNVPTDNSLGTCLWQLGRSTRRV